MNNSILANIQVFCTIDAKEFENGGGGVRGGARGWLPPPKYNRDRERGGRGCNTSVNRDGG